MKKWLLLTEAALGLVLLAYFAKYPLLPEYQSADFDSHVRIATSLAQGLMHWQIPPISQTVLYYGVEFYLALFIIAFHSVPPLFLSRYAMALLVLVSPLIVFYSLKEMLQDKRVALFSALLWAFGGWVWVGMVFNSGLYSNFYGILSSLGLAAATVWFTRGSFKLWRVGVFALILLNALFSHYSTLLIFPALFAYLVVFLREQKTRKPALFALTSLTLPLLAGPLLFPGFIGTLQGFLSANGTGGPTLANIALTLRGWPVLSYFFAEVTSDYAALLLLLLAFLSFMVFLKSRNRGPLIPVVWLITVLVASPSNVSAWRFSFIAIVPVVVLASDSLSRLSSPMTQRLGRKARQVPRRRWVAAVLVIVILSGSWVLRPVVPEGVLIDGIDQSQQLNGYQAQTVSAIGYLNSLPPDCGQYHNLTCYSLSLTDWHFGYSNLLGGPDMTYNPLVASAPEIASFYALQHGLTYLIATNITSYQQFPCQSASLLTLTVRNYTSSSATVFIHLFSVNQSRSSVAVFVNGIQKGITPLVNDSTEAHLNFAKPGSYTIKAQVGYIWSNSEKFQMGVSPPPPPVYVATDLNYCHPFEWDSNALFGAALVWGNFSGSQIHVWKLTA